MNDLWLALANLSTSALTAITGVGGGTILVAIIPFFLPAAAIIPLHGATQLASNVSRAYLSRQQLSFESVYPFVAGAIVGALVFGMLIRWIPLDSVPLFIGLYILATQWSQTVNRLISRVDNFFVLGFVQMGTGLFVGAAGPLHMPRLLARYGTDKAVAVGSVMMSFVHFAKVVVYIILGFDFGVYAGVALLMIVAAVLGSYVGIGLRRYLPASWLKKAIPYILTLLALKMIVDWTLVHYESSV